MAFAEAFVSLRRVVFNTVGGPADHASEGPKDYPDQKDDVILGSGQVAGEDIDQSDHAANEPYVEPPQNPMMDPQMDMLDVH